VIVAREVSKTLGKATILDAVSLEIPRGAITSIIGPNGAGKSTLLAVMSRLMGLDVGTVTVDGLDVTRTPSRELARRLAILRQDNHMSARLTVHDLVSFGRYPYSRGRLTAGDHAHIARALDYLELDGLSHRFLDELSGGQRQRAYAAMVLCQDTDYILLDEPLNNLDMKHARNIMQTLARMCSELGKTVVIVLHDVNFAAWYSDRIIALREGRICHHGPTGDIMQAGVLKDIYGIDIEVIETGGRRLAVYYG